MDVIVVGDIVQSQCHKCTKNYEREKNVTCDIVVDQCHQP